MATHQDPANPLNDDRFESLQYLIDPDNRLLGMLLITGALSLEDAEKIKKKDTYIERNRMVLQCVNRDNKLEDFLLALREADQAHIANYIHYNGERNEDIGGEWPLTERETMILDINKDALIDIINPDHGLLDTLLLEKVINGRQRQTISSKPTIYERNSSLISFLRRRSVRDYWKMIQCLSNTNQRHTAQLLAEGGVAFDVHADISVRGKVQNKSDIEEQISTKLPEMTFAKIPYSSTEAIRRILSGVNLKVCLIAVKKGQSIVLYVYCKVMEDLDHVQDLIASGKINSVLNRIFVRCLSFPVTLVVKTRKIYSSKIVSARNFIKDLENQQKSSIESLKPKLSKTNEFRLLPAELLKMILIEAVLVQMYSKDKAKRESNESIFNILASVDFRWWCSMKKYNLKNKVGLLSKVYFQRTRMRSTIIRNNRNFLKEVIHPDEIIFQLESCGCLTEDQVTSLTRLRNHKEKNHELLVMLKDFSSQKYSKFIDCLFATNQTPAALVLERGGAERQLSIRHVGDSDNLIGFDFKSLERYSLSKYVTSLADKIYIAQKNKILVYEIKYPYHATEPIVVLFDREDPSFPVSITSCNTNKCLYISYIGSSIFKVEPEFENRVSEWLNNTEIESNVFLVSISVTSKGDVLVLRFDIESHMLLIFTPGGTVKRTVSMDKRFNNADYVQEIMPDVVAFSYKFNCIAIMRLDDNGTILRHIECHHPIVAMSSFRYGELLFGVFGYKPAAIERGNSRALVSANFDDSPLGSDGNVIVQLHLGTLESKVPRDLLTTDERIYDIHFAAALKQLYVLSKKKLLIYQLNYEDEDYCP